MSAVAIVPAAGRGLRAGQSRNKALAPFGGEPLLARTLRALAAAPEIDRIVVAVRPEDERETRAIAEGVGKPVTVVIGGETRTQSVARALAGAAGEIALIHDAARPFVSPELIGRCVAAARAHGSAIAALPLTDTVSEVRGGRIVKTPDRSALTRVQTPQAFRYEEIARAYAMIAPGETFTDDAGVYARYVGAPLTVPGEARNVKLTYPEDFAVQREYFTGTGFDAHAFCEGRPLVLGGVTVPCDRGLKGHSDADVLAHALADALLSAAALGDIGRHFPDSDPAYAGARSLDLLAEAVAMLENAGYRVWNASAVVIAERPRLAPYVGEMTDNLAQVMHISTNRLGITATTTERMGFTGRGEGIAVTASAMLAREY